MFRCNYMNASSESHRFHFWLVDRSQDFDVMAMCIPPESQNTSPFSGERGREGEGEGENVGLQPVSFTNDPWEARSWNGN